MYFLLSGCQNPDILRIILLATKILDIVCIVIPIGLIIFLIIDLVKMMISAEDKQNKTLKTIINRIVFSILIFFVPTIVTVVMTLLSNSGINIGPDYNLCIINANKETIAGLQAIQDEQDRIEEEKRKQELQDKLNQNGSNYGDGTGSSRPNGSSGSSNEDRPLTDNGYLGIEGTGNLYNDLATRMLQVANAEVGYLESREANSSGGATRFSKYAESFHSPTSAWCSAFVMWIAKNTEVDNTNLFNDVFQKEGKISNPLSATNSIYTFSNNNNLSFYYSKAYGGNYTPKKGDLVYFYYNGTWDKKITPTMHLTDPDPNNPPSINGHVEIIESVNGNNLITIGGNNSTNQTKTVNGTTYNLRGVTKSSNYYTLDNSSIIGYGSWYNNK